MWIVCQAPLQELLQVSGIAKKNIMKHDTPFLASTLKKELGKN